MILNLSQIQEIVRGAVRIEEDDGYYHLLRFTESQANAYVEACKVDFERFDDFYKKTFATSGIRFAFRTDSRRFSFTFRRMPRGSSRPFFCFDLYQNGMMTAHEEFRGNGVTDGTVSFALDEGEKDVELYLPWSAHLDIKDVTVDDGSTVSGLYRKHRMICFGDSITHGYDARFPSLSYACSISRLLDADEINKGIGGEVFRPELLEECDPFSPDYITVAYGTNDWNRCTRAELTERAEAFYKRLSELYPKARIFAITPICRLNGDQKTVFGAHCKEVDAAIRLACRGIANVTVIRGWSFTPANPDFYADAYLHPNDLGFGLYAANLYKAILHSL